MSVEFIRLKCPECGKRLKVPRRKSARKIKCPKCDLLFRCSFLQPPGSTDQIAGLNSQLDSEIIEAEIVNHAASEYGQVESRTQSSPGLPQPLDEAEQGGFIGDSLPAGDAEDTSHTGSILDDWLDDPDLASLEVVDATLVESTSSSKNRGRRKKRKRSNKGTPPEPFNTQGSTTHTPWSKPNKPTPQDLGGCIAICKKKPVIDIRGNKRGKDAVALLCIILFSILCALVAGLITLRLLGLNRDFSTATALHKAVVAGIYSGYFSLILTFLIYLIRRSFRRMQDMAVEARQLGVRIQKNGQDILIPYEQIRQVYWQGRSDLSGLITSLMVNQNRLLNNVLVLETYRGRKIRMKGCETIFTMPSLTAVINEINKKKGSNTVAPD